MYRDFKSKAISGNCHEHLEILENCIFNARHGAVVNSCATLCKQIFELLTLDA